jgi:hypothetical protein
VSLCIANRQRRSPPLYTGRLIAAVSLLSGRRYFPLLAVFAALAVAVGYFNSIPAVKAPVEGAQNPSPRTPAWPPVFRGDPIGGVTVNGLAATGYVHDPSVTKMLGRPVHDSLPGWFSGGTSIYEGPVMIETHGSHGLIDCIYGTELDVGKRKLAQGANRDDVHRTLGAPHSEYPQVDFYRVVGNQKLGVCYRDNKVDFFELFTGEGSRYQFGWNSKTAEAPPEYPPFPFRLVVTNN